MIDIKRFLWVLEIYCRPKLWLSPRMACGLVLPLFSTYTGNVMRAPVQRRQEQHHLCPPGSAAIYLCHAAFPVNSFSLLNSSICRKHAKDIELLWMKLDEKFGRVPSTFRLLFGGFIELWLQKNHTQTGTFLKLMCQALVSIMCQCVGWENKKNRTCFMSLFF